MGSEFGPAFIQKPDHRPKPNISDVESIPIIDLSPLFTAPITAGDNTLPIRTLVAEIEAACREVGFFQVINHGVPIELLERVQSAAREFFALPTEEKRRVRRNEENFLGYYDMENTKNVRDWKEVFDFCVNDVMTVPASGEIGETRIQEIWNRWPEYPENMRDACMNYSKAIEDLSFKLLELVAMTLNLPAKRLNGYFKDSISRIRLNHYPPCPSPDLALGVGPHKDQGAFTVLAQDNVSGLDVKRKSDGQWVRVKPVPDSYIINIGDLIQVWSNDKYESTEHRVSLNSDKERFSIPFFFYPAHYTIMKPIGELVTEDNPAKYNEFSWGRFFRSRRSSNFQKMRVENLQIYHFRKNN
ncbi:uncharacterized protein A4U43_C07F30650 [Asparagus officinalis]|uniref:Fe2OG dioxygenase domain-containing protein n=1 Tax=Asparagus officinalis TaxID=4686 RepID=A0A5P1EG67_ASPOF|nr:protein DMR6-LIKE OXYGENASE 2-like [Asparagus officinalis]ONK64852.1 uncharacterized protein A4U43_C07F30650 [Asparagus officinalis]